MVKRDNVIEFISGLIFSFLGFFVFAIMTLKFIPIIPVSFGGDKEAAFHGIFFGLPVGSALGVYIGNKLFIKNKVNLLLCSISSLISSLVIGSLISYVILNELWSITLYVLPLIFVLFAVLGFHAPALLNKRVTPS